MLRPFAHPVACCCAKFETGQTFGQQLPTFLLFCDRRSVAQQCWIRLHSSSNIVGATHHCQHASNNSQHCWRNNVGSCCARLHAALDVVRAKNLPFYMVIQAMRRSKRVVRLNTFISQLRSQVLHRQSQSSRG